MTETVKEFIKRMFEDAKDSYEKQTGSLSRWRHRNSITRVYVSSSLFSRLVKEENITTRSAGVGLGNLLVLNQKHPGIRLGLVFDVHSHFLEGYNLREYGPEFCEN